MRDNSRIVYKLTDEHMRTHKGYQWGIGEKRRVENWTGEPCTDGVIHCYESAAAAIFFNPIHANFGNPRLFRALATGRWASDKHVKAMTEELTLTEELPLPSLTLERRIYIAITCAITISPDDDFVRWGRNWISGKDRSWDIAASAADSADSADSAAYSAASADSAAYSAASAASAARSARANFDLLAIIEQGANWIDPMKADK